MYIHVYAMFSVLVCINWNLYYSRCVLTLYDLLYLPSLSLSLSLSPQDEEGLDAKLCTFTQTQREFANQHWYHCHTCKLVKGSGVCSICAKVCHKGHDLTYAKYGSFFCDCGAKEDGSCKALVKRTSGGEGSGSPLSPQRGEKGFFLTKKGRKKHSKKKKREEGAKGDGKSKSLGRTSTHLYGRRSSFPSLPILKLVQQIENYKVELRQYLDQSGVASHTLGLLHSALPPVIRSMDSAASLGCNQARKTIVDLHQQDKEIDYTDSLMVSWLGIHLYMCLIDDLYQLHLSPLSDVVCCA